MTEQEVREKIAKILCMNDTLDWDWLKEQQRYKGEKDCEYYFDAASRILAIVLDALPELAKEAGYKSPEGI